MKFIVLFLLVYIAIAVILYSRKMARCKQLVRKAIPFSYKLDNPKKRILIAGDSLAAGVGAENINETIAGRFHQDFPEAEIVNVSKSGAKLANIVNQIDQVNGKFDLLFMTGGANDIIHLSSFDTIQSTSALLLKKAKERSDKIIWLVSSDIGLAPLWPWPVGLFFSYRSRRYHALFRSLAKEQGVIFVNVFKERRDDLFIKNPKKYYSPDGLHLSSDGYEVWYESIKKVMVS